MDYLIGVDIGSTHTKAVAYSIDGKILGEFHVGYQMRHPQPGRSELDPDKIYQAVISTINRLTAYCQDHRLTGIGFSAAMHSLLGVDEKGKAITPCITWADNRAADIAAGLRQHQQQLYHLTGTPLHAMTPLAKLIWLKENDPVIFHRSATFAGIKEYIIFKILGTWVCDYSIGSATGLMQLRQRTWSKEALKTAGVGLDRLPELVSPHQVYHYNKGNNAVLQIPDQTPFIIGASDGTLAHIGSGATHHGDISVTIGTSSAIRAFAPDMGTDPDMRTFCYLLDEKRVVIGGGANSGGYVLQWLKNDLLQTKISLEKLLDQASLAPPGCEGLLMVPYLLGERAPWWNERLSGSFSSIRIGHRREHFIRAVLEGIIFHLWLIGRVIGEKVPLKRILASGGFVQNPLWLQILADVFQLPVHTSQQGDASARGAAMVAGEALGLAPFPMDVSPQMIIPNMDNAAVYEDSVKRFEKVISYNS